MLVSHTPDGELAARVVRGDGDAFAELAHRFRGDIWRATRWAPLGLTREDLRQEALIALFEVCRTYDPARGAFGSVAGACIRYRVSRASETARRHKHRVLSEALGLDRRPTDDPEALTIAERTPAPDGMDPARALELLEELRRLAATQQWRAKLGESKNGRVYTDAQIGRALELVVAGTSVRQAGAAVGAAHTTVLRWVRDAA